MNINIKATNTTLTPAVKEAVEEKFASLEKFLKSEDKIQVEVEANKKNKSGELFRAEITINPHGYYADAGGSDLYEAIDLLVPKIKEQLVKQKDKKVSDRRKLGAKIKGK